MKTNICPTGRATLLAFILFLSAGTNQAYSQQFLTTIDGWNAYVHLPDDYNDGTNKKYPLICFIPGTGECGTNPASLLVYGPSKFIAEGHNMQFMVNGKLEKPIVISIQPVALWPNAWVINRKLDSILARYRCDVQRINVTGLSMGGWSWANYVDNYDAYFNSRVTSIVSMSAPAPDNTSNSIGLMRYYAMAGGTAWFFEGNLDLRGNDKIRDTMNKYVPGSARYTLYNGGHSGWNAFYTPTYIENGESIYTWMLKQKKALIVAPQSPEADAGNDSSLTNVALTVPLKGLANDPNGLPINFTWKKIEGPVMGNIVDANILETSVTGLVSGIYKFELKVTNSLGLVGSDTIIIANGFGALPVVLTEFKATKVNKKDILLQWSTSSEINSDQFIVEKSKDGVVFSENNRQPAKAKNYTGAFYNYTDQNTQAGLNYYRLKMLDSDGKFAYSKVVAISIAAGEGIAIAIDHIEAKNSFVTMQISSEANQLGSLIIMDAQGKILANNVISLSQGSNRISQQVTLPGGVYYAYINASGEKLSKAFIK